jgi:hypothetical protein
MAALDLTYEHYVEINGGEHCGICGKPRSPERRWTAITTIDRACRADCSAGPAIAS